MKGKKGFQKGNKHGKKNKGRIRSEETKRRLSLSHKGKVVSDSQKEKIREIMRARIGDKNPNWRGGYSIVSRSVRASSKYRFWRSDVFTRDDFTCQSCYVRGGKIEADHIIPFSEIWHRNKVKTFDEAMFCEELWNVNNGRTLCINCHKNTETYGKKYHVDNH